LCDIGLPGHCEHSKPEEYAPEGGPKDRKGGGTLGEMDLYDGCGGG
jgi:hypothetical protein